MWKKGLFYLHDNRMIGDNMDDDSMDDGSSVVTAQLGW